MNEKLRAEYWLKCWIAVANSSNSTQTVSCTSWADAMLKEYDKRFPQIEPNKNLKEESSPISAN